MGAILLAVTGLDPKPWEERFRTLAPQRDIRIWPDRVGEPADVAYACAWHAPNGLFARFAHLKVIFSLGAGVDHVVADPHLPDVPVVRIVDADLTMRMTEYVVLHVLMHHRRQRLYDAQQRARVWRELEQSAANEVAVGVMGLGVLGRDAASALRRLGFRVAGWSRTPKTLTDVETFDGQDGLDAFLRRTEILVCLLPATAATRGVLNLSLLRRLKRDGAAGGAYLINAGRGALQVDADIVAALDEGSLAAATLDVFPTEPLPATSPLWTHPKVTITPHNAAASDPHALVANILRSDRTLRGRPAAGAGTGPVGRLLTTERSRIVCVARIFEKSWSDRESRRRRSLFHDVQLDLRDTSSGNSKRLGSGRRDVDDASRDERTAVIDPNGHRPAGGDVGDTHLGTERQCAVSSGQLLRIEFFTARGPRLMPIKTGETIRAAGRLGCLFIGRFARRWSAFLRGDGHSSVVFE